MTSTDTSTDTATDTAIFHNPHCSTSRKALALMQERGLQPQVIQYLLTPPDRSTLARLIAASGRPVADFVRRREALYSELGLGETGVTDVQRMDALLAHPRLLERPIVVTPQGTCLGRPLAAILEVLPPPR